ncbi:unnamed protein product, partial [Thlaspi arvense]
ETNPNGGELSFSGGNLCTSGSANLNKNGLVTLTNSKNHIVAVELDAKFDEHLGDINDNHVGIDINSLESEIAAPSAYFKDDDGTPRNLSLSSGDLMQVWIEYDNKQKQLSVTLHPIGVPKPKIPLLSLQKDLSPYLLESMYVGFSSSTGELTASHYIFDWKFKMDGMVSDINHSRLPKIPSADQRENQSLKRILVIRLSVSGVTILILFINRKTLMEVLEDWEVQFGPHRFAYKDLHIVTRGFKDSELLGKGGFGKVYKGALPVSNMEIAVKKVSHDSRQGMREFIAEIATIGRTLGYISPELSRTGKASKRSDVFALRVVMLEITCGRKPILSQASQSKMILTEWVLECWEKGDIMQVLDHKIGQEYIEEQVELVLKLGLLCSHSVAAMRPSMSSVIQFLDNVSQLPHNLLDIMKAQETEEAPDSPASSSIAPLTFTELFVSYGR